MRLKATKLVSAFALALLAAGCGKVTEGGGGAAADAMAPEPDGTPLPEPVTVLVRYNGSPSSGAFVFYHDTSGAQIGEALTGEDGSVELTEVPAGGAVTVYLSEEKTLDSVLAVQPGDVLQFDSFDARDFDPPPPLVTMQVTTPAEGEGASLFLVRYPCRPASSLQVGSGSTVNAEVSPFCADQPDIPIVTYGNTAAGPQRINGSFVDQVDFQNLDSPVVMPTPVALGAINASMPPITGDAAGQGRVEFHPMYRDLDVEGPQSFTYTPDGTAVVNQATFVDGLYEGFRVNGRISNNTGETLDKLFMAVNQGPTLGTDETPTTTDLTQATPFIDSVSVDSEDPLTVSFTTTSTDCGNGDVDMLHGLVRQTFNDETYFWRIMGPGGDGPLVYPTLTPFTQSQLWPDGDLDGVTAGFMTHEPWTYDDIRNVPSISTYVEQSTRGAPVGERSCGANRRELL